MDLQQIDLNNAIDANNLNKKFNNLRWITPFYYKEKPSEEIELLQGVLKVLSKENHEEIIIITHYQFFSLILDKKINILNRWYFPENNTHPTSINNKFYSHYIKRNQNIIKKNNIKKIYLINSYPGEFSFINIKDFLNKQCFKKEEYNKMLSIVYINSCN